MKFGTSGLRGLARDLDGSASTVFAEAFVIHLRRLGLMAGSATLFIGRDFRDSSPAIRDRCATGLARQGASAIDCGPLPTPALAHYAMERGAASLMITGSHIPEDRNGIKFYRPDGEISKEDERAIKAIADELQAVDRPADSPAPDLASDDETAQRAFIERCKGILPKGSLDGMRVGVYQHSSVGRDMLHEVLDFYGAETVPLQRSETFVAVDTEAVSPQTLDILGRWAMEHNLDAIVSTDGDADRPLVADERGVPLRGDLLGLVCAELVGAGLVATPVTSNSGIRATESCDIVRTKVGSPYVIEAMKNAAADQTVVGFEANGGFLLHTDAQVPGGLLKALPTRDCFLPILAALHATVESGKPLSNLSSSRNFPIAVADRLTNFPTEAGETLVHELSQDPQNAARYFGQVGDVTGLDTTDGARFTLNGSEIVHYRPSGNAPELRCYCEAAHADRAEELLRFGLSKASQRL